MRLAICTTQCDAVHDTETSTSIEVELVNPELIVCKGICCSIESDGPFRDLRENHFLPSIIYVEKNYLMALKPMKDIFKDNNLKQLKCAKTNKIIEDC